MPVTYSEMDDPIKTKHGYKNLKDGLNPEIYELSFPGTDLMIHSVVTRVILFEVFPVMRFPNSGSPRGPRIIRRPDHWINGHIDITFHYSSDTAAGNSFLIFPGLRGWTEDADVAGTGYTGLFVGGVVPPESTIAHKLRSFTVRTATKVDSSMRFLGVMFVRASGDALDTSTGNFDLHSVHLKYFPESQ